MNSFTVVGQANVTNMHVPGKMMRKFMAQWNLGQKEVVVRVYYNPSQPQTLFEPARPAIYRVQLEECGGVGSGIGWQEDYQHPPSVAFPLTGADLEWVAANERLWAKDGIMQIILEHHPKAMGFMKGSRD